jgi:hypothetical protein
MIGFLLSGTVIRSQLGEIGVVHGKTMKQLRATFKLLNDFLKTNGQIKKITLKNVEKRRL